MAPYYRNGFLGKDIEVWKTDNREKYADLFGLAVDLNSECYAALAKAKPHNKDKRELIIACLFPRTMELFQAVYLLVTLGMVPSANIMLRSLIETIFTLTAVAKDDEALDAYILNDEFDRIKTANKIMNNQASAFADIPIDEIVELKSQLEKKYEEKKPRKYSAEDFAKKAGLHDWYLTAYAVTSKSVHAAIKDMEQYLDIDPTQKVKSIKFIPSDKGTVGILSTACNAAGIALEAFLVALKLEADICREYAEELKPFMELALNEKE